MAATDAEGEASAPASLATGLAAIRAAARVLTAPAFGCVQWAPRESDGIP